MLFCFCKTEIILILLENMFKYQLGTPLIPCSQKKSLILYSQKELPLIQDSQQYYEVETISLDL